MNNKIFIAGIGAVIAAYAVVKTEYSAAAGTHEWEFPNGSPYKQVQRIIFKEDVVTISEIRVKRHGKTFYRVTRTDLDYGLQRYGNCVALQAGFVFWTLP